MLDPFLRSSTVQVAVLVGAVSMFMRSLVIEPGTENIVYCVSELTGEAE